MIIIMMITIEFIVCLMTIAIAAESKCPEQSVKNIATFTVIYRH